MKLASIDIGTNTLRLLIGDVDRSGRITDTLLKREITRLGGNFNGQNLDAEARSRTLRALMRFSALIKKSGVENVRAAATSVVRDAQDGDLFIKEVREKAGIDVEVISGDVEGAITLKGVLSALEDKKRNYLVFDIGGGSTEFILAVRGRITGLTSINMGVVALAEKYLQSDPLSTSDISRITSVIDDFINRLTKENPSFSATDIIAKQNALLVGTAGTITSLAALDQNLNVYDTRKINNYVLKYESVCKQFERLSRLTHEERANIRALEEGRADLIIPGTIIVMKVMKAFGFKELVVSDYGLLEGLLIDMAENAAADEPA